MDREGTPYPVIVIPEGVKVPVAAKAELVDPGTGDRLIDVYFRTLRANGVASTSIARPEDWDNIIEICIGNQEGDVAKFLRRYFPEFAAAIGGIGMVASSPPSPDLKQRAEELLERGTERFEQALSEHGDG